VKFKSFTSAMGRGIESSRRPYLDLVEQASNLGCSGSLVAHALLRAASRLLSTPKTAALTRISLIVNSRRSITADTAMRLAHYFGTSAQMWMNLQTAYDLEVVAKKAAVTKREVIPASNRAA